MGSIIERIIMIRGKYIVLEGAQGVGKSTIADMLVHELLQLGLSARLMHEPDGKADATTSEIRRLTQDPKYPMNTRTEVLLYNAARSQSLEAVRAARDGGDIVIVDRSFLTTLAVQFYGRGDIADYRRLNEIIAFAVGDMWPDLTIVLDAPVQMLHERARQRGETERFDNLAAETLERIRAGYLWEAKQRNMPVVYATGRIDEVFEAVWRHVAVLLELEGAAVTEPTSVAAVLAKSSAAQELSLQQNAKINAEQSTYFVPQTLPDDIQCDYCDDIERLLSDRRKLVSKLVAHLRAEDATLTDETLAKKSALMLLRPLLPIACAREELRNLLTTTEPIVFDSSMQKRIPNGFASSTERVQLVGYTPRNELNLLPAMLYESLDLPMNEVKATVEKWPYEVKSRLFLEYVRRYPHGKALAGATYEWDFLAEFGLLQDLPNELHTRVKLQMLTPRYGYDMPPEVEAAGLSDDYDAIFDQSLQLQSTLQARGFLPESQYATLLGHKQRWSMTLSAPDTVKVFKHGAQMYGTSEILAEKHPLLSGAAMIMLDSEQHYR
ncbi:dTMP kinase [Candidatus Saccharibacteria bacterium]|nr:MAG: dTMP kinase [Candidatus Saccharibacteria bacterium]